VIVGDIGYRDHMVFTALGDAVNVAARLQDMTKILACEAVVSDEVRATAGLAADALPQLEVAIRGRNEPMVVRTVADTPSLASAGRRHAGRGGLKRTIVGWAKARSSRRAHHLCACMWLECGHAPLAHPTISPASCERSEAIHLAAQRKNGLFSGAEWSRLFEQNLRVDQHVGWVSEAIPVDGLCKRWWVSRRAQPILRT